MATYDSIRARLIPDVEFHQNRYARELDQALAPHARWLDIGTGRAVHNGWLGPSQHTLASRASVLIGCDLVPSQLASNDVITAGVAADAGALPFPDASFDLVTANMVLEHLPDPAHVFREVARVLAAGGRFLFVTPNRRHPAVWLMSVFIAAPWRRRLAKFVERRELDDIFLTHYLANTGRVLRRLASAAGLDPAFIEEFPSFPMFRAPNIAVAAESLFIRSLRWRPLRGFASNIVGSLVKRPLGAAPAPRVRHSERVLVD